MSAVKTWPAHALASVLLLSMGLATAQAATLRDAFEHAWSVQAPAQYAQNQRYSAQFLASQAWTPEPPTLGLSHTSDQLNANTGRREWELALSTPIWLYGQRERAVQVAHTEQAAFAGASRLAQLALAGALREAWWDVRAAELEVELAQNQVNAEQALAVDVKQRLKAGDLAPSDARQSHIGVLQAKKNLGMAQLTLQRAQQSFTLLSRGAALPASAEVETETEAAGAHPLLASLGLTANSAQAKLQQAAGDTPNAPEIGLSYTVEKDASDAAYRGRIKLGFQIPLGAQSRNLPRIAAANAELIQAQLELEQQVTSIASGLKIAQSALIQSRAELDIAAEQRQLSAEQAQSIDKGYRLGQFDLTTQLKSQQAQLAAQSEYARARLAVNRAISRLNQAAGILP
ncbi:TolC family protein [uncultured Deefgea sp.]|uniref:TolC family protein n=1 Tax=uncultured Deefgea sp. TaxID=1304914 RepID=UPI002623A091|nr:TolC family protein [uncultured Deefgea sp.]